MNGMEMMMKSILGAAGFDPEKFKTDVEKGLHDARDKYDEVKAQLNRIEANQKLLLASLAPVTPCDEPSTELRLISGGQTDG